MATLGEYLFYAATLVDEVPSNSVWRISASTITFLTKTIENNEEDELVRLYSCKTVENITSQSVAMGLLLCKKETVIALVSLFDGGSRNEDCRCSAMVSLSHLARLSRDLLEGIVAQLGGVWRMCEILKGENASHRTQQATLTVIIFHLLQFESP